MNRCHATRFDLRPAFARALALVAFAPEDDDDGDPSLDDDPVSDGAGGASGEGSDDAAGDEDEDKPDEKVDNPRLKQVSDEAARYRRLRREEMVKREAAEKRVVELETAAATARPELVEENNTLRLRLAFNDACHDGGVSDRDAVWKLAGDDLGNLVGDDGKVDDGRLSAVIASVLQRYPAFTKEWSETHDAPPKDGFPLVPSGRPTNGRQQVKGTVVDFATLANKFPALRNH